VGKLEQLCLTVPSDDGRSTRWVTGRFLKKLARDLFSLPLALYGDDLAVTAASVTACLKALGKDAVLSLLRRPQVHVFLCCATSALQERDIALARVRARELLLQLVFEMSLDGSLSEDVHWTGPFPLERLMSPIHGKDVGLSGVNRLCFSSSGCRGEDADLQWNMSAFPKLETRFVLSLADSNPMSDFEAHPDKKGNQLSLGDTAVEGWLETMVAALRVVAEGMPGIYREMSLIHQQFIPVGTDAEKHLSASYQESVGTVYMTLHPQLLTMVEAIIHEFQHNKINMLFHVDPVLENAFFPLFSSPVRPDPRPLHGVLLAAHAFVPVAELYRRLVMEENPLSRRGGFMERFEQIIASNTAALDVLVSHAKPTRLGQAVIDEMVSLNDSHRAFMEGR
jgi:hypothetical protein